MSWLEITCNSNPEIVWHCEELIQEKVGGKWLSHLGPLIKFFIMACFPLETARKYSFQAAAQPQTSLETKMMAQCFYFMDFSAGLQPK